jgi:putative membrane protein
MDNDPIQVQTEGGFEPLVYKNHVTTILQNIISMLIGLGFMALVMYTSSGNSLEMGRFGLCLIGAVAVMMSLVYVRIWMKTTYTFNETELTVFKDTVFKNLTNIQYSKMASVNVRRTVLNHIFGTTTLLFNINSSINAVKAEATLTLKTADADVLREWVSGRILSKPMPLVDDRQQETLVEVRNIDVILHGFFGQPTTSSLVGLASLGYSILTMFTGSGGLVMALILFGVSSVLPWIRTILRYYNYRIYRVGDTITVESGLLNVYRSSFNTKKVNSIRVREPLLARLMGKSLLEAEVVGLADSEGMPLLCPLKSKAVVRKLANEIVPEFIFDCENGNQPKESFIPTMGIRVLASVISMIMGLSLLAYVMFVVGEPANPILRYILYAAYAILIIVIPAIIIVHGLLAQKNREFAMSSETFLFVTGAYDRQTDYMRYDKVQIASVTAGILQRRFGVGRCTVNIMSSKGVMSLTSGIFRKDELEAVGQEVIARIRDGRYDYRRYQ